MAETLAAWVQLSVAADADGSSPILQLVCENGYDKQVRDRSRLAYEQVCIFAFTRRICFSGDRSDQDSKVAPQNMTQPKARKVPLQKAEL